MQEIKSQKEIANDFVQNDPQNRSQSSVDGPNEVITTTSLGNLPNRGLDNKPKKPLSLDLTSIKPSETILNQTNRAKSTRRLPKLSVTIDMDPYDIENIKDLSLVPEYMKEIVTNAKKREVKYYS